MQQHPDYTRKRLQRLAGRLEARIYATRKPADEMLVSPRVDRIPYAEAVKLKYRRARLGEQFRPLWATYWFKVKARVPPAWKGRRVDLLWVSHSEATLWQGGRSVQGLNYDPASWGRPTRPDAVLVEKARGGETVAFEIEMACNGLFGADVPHHFKNISPFVLDQCDLALFDADAWQLYYDFMVLQQLEAEQARDPKDLDRTWGGELLSELNRFANEFDFEDRATWGSAHRILKALYKRRNATQTHELSAIGHAHIDTAWLWPLAETWRKCTRTFSSQVRFMDVYPEYKFACSQACQFAAMKERNPDLYRRIKARVRRGQFVPVGGTWVEPDCNIPSGEALARQFLYGQRFFQKEFGITCREFWNPDVFGYNGQLPQLMRLSGIQYFLTQKLSWNGFNKPLHQTFTWQGVDGSEVLTHFPPADTYNADCNIRQLRDNARNYKDNDRSRHSLLLFGHGDGGGGPTKQMLEILRRARDLQGLPRTKIRSSAEFFAELDRDCTDRPVVVGELYFELHRGTYTTQAATKRNNRRNEFLLHDAEYLAAVAQRLRGARYPSAELERLWRLLLTNQFHDILPGSSIGAVYEDTSRDHAEIRAAGEALCARAIERLAGAGRGKGKEVLAGKGSGDARLAGKGPAHVPINTTGFARAEVARAPDGQLVFAVAPSYGVGEVRPAPDRMRVKRLPGGRIQLENAHLRAVLSPGGALLSLRDKDARREALSGPGNVLEIYDDQPVNSDAWDVDPFMLETGRDCPPATRMRVVGNSGLRTAVRFERRVGAASKLTQTVRLDAGARRLEFHTDVDWRESHKMLKVAFPVNVRAMNATYEMQFACVERPTHYNTTYDLAKFEVPGHKWADLGEHGFGVALLTDCKYGYSTYGNTLRISLLRAPKSPDPQADLGRHEFAYAIFAHAGTWQEAGVVAEGYRFNVPLRWAPADEVTARPGSFAAVDTPNLVLDTIKKAEDSDALVLRLYEAHGARGTARLKLCFPFRSARFCNILEEVSEPARITARGEIEVPYRPYQIIGVMVR